MNARPALLDVGCCEGGASAGYVDAGFTVLGVDVRRRERYPFPFFLTDFRDLDPRAIGKRFASVHISVPCQRFSTITKRNGTQLDHPDLIAAAREWVNATGLPWTMENVVGAPLECAQIACGSAFSLFHNGYRLRRHRLFEANWPLVMPPCVCAWHDEPVLDVTGGGDCALPRLDGGGGRPRKGSAAEVRSIMRMPWATKAGCNEAIAPPITAFIGSQLKALL